jgi:deferrochelatase/peroxidase EfeB
MEKPQPNLKSPFQSGITDPQWPVALPHDISKQESASYAEVYAGQIDRQSHLHIVRADIRAGSRKELQEVLLNVSQFAVREMNKTPARKYIPALDETPRSYRVTITVGFGASLFLTEAGDDRFDMRAFKPRYLKVMPRFGGDSPAFSPSEQASDLLFLIASDHIYVNVYLVGLLVNGEVDSRLFIRDVEEGYARPDNHESSGFMDGISNPTNAKPAGEMDHLTYIQSVDEEPRWCTNGTYLAYRKVQQNLKAFLKRDLNEQQGIFGIDKRKGERLQPRPRESHSFKLHPNRPDADLFDCHDNERRFVRRPYFYFQGVDQDGSELRGLHHISFVRNLRKQYEWPVEMWQTNPDFPVPGTGIDALYQIATNVGGGYYFCPPGPKSPRDFLGSEIFAAHNKAHTGFR